MTIVELSPNGLDPKDRARQLWEAGTRSTEIAARTGVPERTVRSWTAKWKAEPGKAKRQPPAAVPVADGKRERQTTTPARGKRPVGSLAGMRAVVAVVAGVAAILSYSHIVELAIAAGAGWRAYILPLSLDGLVAACTYTLVAGGKGRWLAWAGITVGLVGSVAANVIAVRPDLVDLEIVAAVLAGFPPVALAVSAHLLVRTAAAR